jgi:hypothetical protein
VKNRQQKGAPSAFFYVRYLQSQTELIFCSPQPALHAGDEAL